MIEFIEFRNHPLRFSSEGVGHTLVLLHGFLESLEIWEEFSLKLAPNFRVVAIDLPGHGESGYYDEIHSMELMAECVNAVLTHLQVDHAVVVGHSMGGYVAVHLAEMYPEKIQGFGFFHSHADADTPEGKHNRDRAIAILNKNAISWINQFIPDLFAKDNQDRFAQEIKQLQQIAGRMTARQIIAAQAGMRDRASKLVFLKATKKPVLFILGKDDSKMAVARILEQTLLPRHCEVLLLDRVGHMGFIEAPAITLNFLKGFLNTVFSTNP